MLRFVAALALLLNAGCFANVTWLREPPRAARTLSPAAVQLIDLHEKEGLQQLPDGIVAGYRQLAVAPPHRLIGALRIEDGALRYAGAEAVLASLREEAAEHGANLLISGDSSGKVYAVALGAEPPATPRSIDEREAELAAAHPEYQREQAWEGTLAAPPQATFQTRAGRCYALAVAVGPEAVWSVDARRQFFLQLERKQYDGSLSASAWAPKELPRAARTVFLEAQCASLDQAVSVAVHFAADSGHLKLGEGPVRFLLYGRKPKDGELAALARQAAEAAEKHRRAVCSPCWRVAQASCAVALSLCNPYQLCLRDSGLTGAYCK